MIKKIEKINYGKFQDFKWPKDLYEFSPWINIVFGWNGSGKTTLSKIFKHIQNQTSENDCAYKIVSDSESYSNDELKKVELRVFNQDYVSETLKSDSKLPYIFFAGKEAVDYSVEEDKLKIEKENLSNIDIPNKHDDIAKDTAYFIKAVPGINSIRKELTGTGLYSNYNKEDFIKRIDDIKQKLDQNKIQSAENLLKKDINSLSAQLSNSDRASKINKDISESASWILDHIDKINETLAGKPIQILSQRIDKLSSKEKAWVESGVELHYNTDVQHKKCLFCDSEIKNTDELLKHFSQAVVMAMEEVDGYIKQIDSLLFNLSREEMTSEEQDKIITTLKSQIEIILKSLRGKRNEISNSFKAIDINKEVLENFVKIQEENVSAIAYSVETHYVALKYKQYLQELAKYETAVKQKEETKEKVKELERQLQELKQKAKNTHQSSKELNILFKVAFPYRNIEITENEEQTGYILKRDGNFCSFSSLSEGERNFIALAYFIRSINDDQNKLSSDGIVLIDDPVSSLDKQAIFQIFSIVVEEMKKYKDRQYFVLTHNLDLLGHFKEHFDKQIRNNTIKIYSITMTKMGCNISAIHKLLKYFRSDYYYVFSILNSLKESNDLSDSYLIVNLLRRWLETLLEFKFSTSGDLYSTLEKAYSLAKEHTKDHATPFSANNLEMYRFLNHGSHGFSDTESIDDSILINSSLRITEAFELVRIIDTLHYKKSQSLTIQE